MKTAQHSDGSEDDPRTRDRVLGFLLAQGPKTTNEISSALDLTSAGIRRHLSLLEADGLIEGVEVEQTDGRGRGRPPKLYQLTSRGRGTFGQSYDELALIAIEELIKVGGPDAIRRIAETRFEGVRNDFEARLVADPELTPVAALTQALDASGYFASSIECGDDISVEQRHCPIVRVANKYPELCQAEAAIIAELLGADVEDHDTIAQGQHSCILRVVSSASTKLPDPKVLDSGDDAGPVAMRAAG